MTLPKIMIIFEEWVDDLGEDVNLKKKSMHHNIRGTMTTIAMS